MTNIYLVRHAEVDYIPDDFMRPLSEKGMVDTEKVTKVFRNIDIDIVLSSPYIRAIDTVEGIAMDKGIDIELIDSFRERKVDDTPVEDFKTFTKLQWENFGYSLENGESLNDVQKRGIDALLKVLDKYKDKNIVIGTHGTILCTILNYFDKSHDYSFWRSIKMPDVFKLSFEGKNLKEIIRIDI